MIKNFFMSLFFCISVSIYCMETNAMAHFFKVMQTGGILYPASSLSTVFLGWTTLSLGMLVYNYRDKLDLEHTFFEKENKVYGSCRSFLGYLIIGFPHGVNKRTNSSECAGAGSLSNQPSLKNNLQKKQRTTSLWAGAVWLGIGGYALSQWKLR